MKRDPVGGASPGLAGYTPMMQQSQSQ